MIAAALLVSQPLYVYADTQISLEGPSGQNAGNTGSNNNQMNSTNGLPMAGTEGTQMGGTNQSHTQSPNGVREIQNVPGGNTTNGNSGNSNVEQVPGQGSLEIRAMQEVWEMHRIQEEEHRGIAFSGTGIRQQFYNIPTNSRKYRKYFPSADRKGWIYSREGTFICDKRL